MLLSPCSRKSARSVAVKNSSNTPQSVPSTAVVGTISLSLPTKEMKEAVTFELVPHGRGKQAIMVVDVVPNTAAEQAGVHRGQRLSAISDAVRDGPLWPLSDRPSMRFIRDCFRMRTMGRVTLEFQECFSEEQASRLLSDMGRYNDSGSDGNSSSSDGYYTEAPPGNDTASTSSWGMLGASGQGKGSAPLETIGERMARRKVEVQEQDAARPASDLQQRQQRRQEYMEMSSKGDNSGLFTTAAVVFLGPAAIILAIAYFSGYLDTLSAMY